MKKLYLVKREVFATTLERALSARGKVYAVELAEDRFQPDPKKELGFKKKKPHGKI